jgi:putative transposase
MHIGQALDLVSCYDSLRNPLTSLGDYLDPELISRCLAEAGTVTLRKRRLPLEMMVWCIVGMALERKEPFIRSSTVWTSCCRAVVPSSPPAR